MHITYDNGYVNPRRVRCYDDEDMVGKMKRVYCKCHGVAASVELSAPSSDSARGVLERVSARRSRVSQRADVFVRDPLRAEATAARRGLLRYRLLLAMNWSRIRATLGAEFKRVRHVRLKLHMRHRK